MAAMEAQVTPAETTEITTKEPTAPAKADAVIESKTKDAAKAAPPSAAAPSSSSKSTDTDPDSDDDPNADDKGLVTLPLTTFQARIRRATRTELKRLFGTDSVSDIMAMKRELDEHRTEKETARQKSLAEIDQIREEMARERSAREAAEQRATDIEMAQLADREDVKIRGIAEKHIKPKFYKSASRDLKEYLLEEYGDDLDKVKHSDIAKWFAEYAKENPELAVVAAAEEVATPAPARPTTQLTNGPQGVRPTSPASGGNNVQGKTARLGRENSMTDAELAQLKQKFGVSW